MVKVEMYESSYCPYCVMAKRLLDHKGVQYESIMVGSNTQLWDEMVARSQRHTVPQIFINDESIGGYDDLAHLEKTGKLDALLKAG
jgi:glutaredoxin 3